jgi:hypothetical protein
VLARDLLLGPRADANRIQTGSKVRLARTTGGFRRQRAQRRCHDLNVKRWLGDVLLGLTTRIDPDAATPYID